MSTVQLQSSLQSPGTPNSRQRARGNLRLRGSVACTATGGSSTLVFAPAFGVDTRLAHPCSCRCTGPVGSLLFSVSGSWGSVCVTTGTSTSCSGVCCCTRSSNGWTFRSRCCAIGMCVAGVHAVCQLVKVLSESAFVWIQSVIKPFTLACGFSPASGPDFMTSDFSDTSSVSCYRLCSLNPPSRNLAWHSDDMLHSSFRNPLLRNLLDHLRNLFHRNQWKRDIHDLCQCAAPVGPPRSSGPSVLLAPVVALHHNCYVHSLVSVLDLWELHGLLLVRITSFCIIADTSAILSM